MQKKRLSLGACRVVVGVAALVLSAFPAASQDYSKGELPAFIAAQLPPRIRVMLENCNRMNSVQDTREVMQLARDVYANPDPYFSAGKMAQRYAECQVNAAAILGNTYFYGRGIPKNYAQAAWWYTKALSSNLIGPQPPGYDYSKVNLGLLFAYGLGVPQDKAQARELWASAKDSNLKSGGPRVSALIRLLDHNALPPTMGDEQVFTQQVKDASSRIESGESQEHADVTDRGEREQARELAKATTFVCDLGDPKPMIVSIYQSRTRAQLEFGGNVTGFRCHLNFTDGARGELAGPADAYGCMAIALGGAGGDVRQHVDVSDGIASISATKDSGELAYGVTLNMAAGLLKMGGSTYQCRRPHG